MQINSTNRSNNLVQFKGDDNKPGKNNLAALSSMFVLPGIGETLNGQPNATKRLAEGIGITALMLASGFGISASTKMEKYSKKFMLGSIALLYVSSLTNVVLRLKSGIEAYRYDTRGKIGKNAIPGLASFLTIPGVGEKMNGQSNADTRIKQSIGLIGLYTVSAIAGWAMLFRNNKIVKAAEKVIDKSEVKPTTLLDKIGEGLNKEVVKEAVNIDAIKEADLAKEITKKPFKLGKKDILPVAAFGVSALSILAFLGLKIKSGIEAYKYNPNNK